MTVIYMYNVVRIIQRLWNNVLEAKYCCDYQHLYKKSTLDIAFKLVISIAIHLSEVGYQSVYFRIQQTGIRLLLMRERATCLEVP